MKKKLAILLAAGALAVLLAEIVLRVFFGGYITQIYTLDEALLHRLIPGTSKLFVHHPVNGSVKVPVAVNADGFRGEPLQEAGTTRRVVVFGDSFVMAEVTVLAETFVEQLEAQLNAVPPGGGNTANGLPFECINAGVVAYGPDQTLGNMERVLAKSDADLAVVTVFADNDFGDLMRNKMFLLDETSGALVEHPFVIDDELRQKFGQGLGTSAIWRFAQRVRRGLRADHATEILANASPEALLEGAHHEVEKWVNGCSQEYRDYVIDRKPNVRFLFEDHFDADVAVAPTSESARYKIRLLTAIVAQMAQVARDASVPLAVVVIPSPYDLCGPEHGGVVDRAKYPDYRPAALSGRVEAMAESAGLPCINLFAAFRDNTPDDLYFLAPDNHWNAAGQALAAREVAAFLIGTNLVPGR